MDGKLERERETEWDDVERSFLMDNDCMNYFLVLDVRLRVECKLSFFWNSDTPFLCQ